MKKYNLIILQNQGFCFGVRNAIDEVFSKIDSLPKPVFLLGDLVHNRYVTEKLVNLGITVLNEGTRLEMLDNIDSGSVIISAHGVSNEVYAKIKEKNLSYLDTTCPFVKKAHCIINDYLNSGYDVVYIGKKNHPEAEAVRNLKSVHIVENSDDIMKLNITNEKIAVVNQTTISTFHIKKFHLLLISRYHHVKIANSVCNVTANRQQELSKAIMSFGGEPGLVIVIGDKKSNNTASLAKRASIYADISVLKVENVNDIIINLFYIKDFSNIIIASGTSTPQEIIDEIILKLKKYLNI